MVSYSIVPFVFNMAELRAIGLWVFIIFLVDAKGFVSVFAIHLSIRLFFMKNIIWVEHEIYNPHTSLLSFTFRENSKLADNKSILWKYGLGKYKVNMP